MKTSRIDSLVSFVLISSPILFLYGWGAFNFFIVFSLLLIGYCALVKKEIPLKFPNEYLYYVIYFCLISIARNGVYNFHIGILLSMVLMAFYLKKVNYASLVKMYRMVANVNITIFILQFFSIIDTTGVIQGLPISESYYTSADVSYKLSVLRKSALFGEPAQFAQFLLPLITIELFNNYSKKWYRLSIYILTIFLLQSGNGYIGLGCIVLYYLITFPFKKSERKVPAWIISCVFVCFVAYGFTQTNLGVDTLKRKQELKINEDEFSSGYIRIWRGYEIYSRLSLSAKVFGASKKEVTKAANKGEWYEFLGNPEYMNTFQNFLCFSGVIGTIIFALFNYNLFKKNTRAGKAIILLFIVLSLMSSMYFSGIMLIYYVLAYTEKKRYNGLINK